LIRQINLIKCHKRDGVFFKCKDEKNESVRYIKILKFRKHKIMGDGVLEDVV